jgi:hypothetical protein
LNFNEESIIIIQAHFLTKKGVKRMARKNDLMPNLNQIKKLSIGSIAALMVGGIIFGLFQPKVLFWIADKG